METVKKSSSRGQPDPRWSDLEPLEGHLVGAEDRRMLGATFEELGLKKKLSI